MSKPKLVIMVGLPYSGKSTLAKSLGLYDYEVISSDNMLMKLAAELGKTYNEVFKTHIDMAMELTNKQYLQALKDKKDILIDQTNLTINSRRRKMSQVPSAYTKICIYVPQPTQVELQVRMEERKTHRVPEFVMESMLTTFQEPTIEEGFDIVYKAGFDDIFISKES